MQIPVPLSLLGGLGTIERQVSLMLNLISSPRPVLAALSGCKQTPCWIPSPPLCLLFLSFALSELLAHNHPPASQLLQKGMKHGEMLYIHPRNTSAFSQVCVASGVTVWMRIWSEESCHIQLCITQVRKSPESFTGQFAFPFYKRSLVCTERMAEQHW